MPHPPPLWKVGQKKPNPSFQLNKMGGAIIMIHKVQYSTSINLSMRINISICIFLPKNYNSLVFYHVNSPLQLNFNSTNTQGSRSFPNFNICLHSPFNTFIWSQCNHIFYFLSNHLNFYTLLFHNTSNATCTIL